MQPLSQSEPRIPAIENFHHAQHHRSRMDKHDILSLVHTVASTVALFRPSDARSPINDMIERVQEQCKRLQIPVPHASDVPMKEYIGVTHWALGLSPLVLFLPRLGIRQTVGQVLKLRAFATIGSRPARLAEIERQIWRSIVSLAVGNNTVVDTLTTTRDLITGNQLNQAMPVEWRQALRDAGASSQGSKKTRKMSIAPLTPVSPSPPFHSQHRAASPAQGSTHDSSEDTADEIPSDGIESTRTTPASTT